MQNFLLTADAAAEGGGIVAMLTTFLPMILLFVVLYLVMIRPQKKKDKAIQEMRSKIDVGDEIVTIGGIIGRVVSVKDDTFVIESGSDRSKIRISRWAVQTNNTIHDDGPSK